MWLFHKGHKGGEGMVIEKTKLSELRSWENDNVITGAGTKMPRGEEKQVTCFMSL